MSLNKTPDELREIPLEACNLGEEEIGAAVEVLRSGRLWQFNSSEVEAFEQEFAAYHGVSDAIAVTNCGSALEIALRAAGIGIGDEVITTPFTFIATNMAIANVGAVPVFADIDAKTYNLDPASVAERISERTKGILPVHIFGHPCEMDDLTELAERHRLVIIEDCAQSVGARYRGQLTGSIGAFGCFSLSFPKNMTAGGEGGMLTTNSPELAHAARLLRSYGYERIWTLEGYQHTVLGGNYRMMPLQAAIGRVQLRKLDGFNRKRQENAAYFNGALSELSGLKLPSAAPHIEHAWHQYVLQIDAEVLGRTREAVYNAMREAGVEAGAFYPAPTYRQHVFQARLGHAWHCPGAESSVSYGDLSLPTVEQVCARVLALPVHPLLAEDDCARIVRSLRRACGLSAQSRVRCGESGLTER